MKARIYLSTNKARIIQHVCFPYGIVFISCKHPLKFAPLPLSYRTNLSFSEAKESDFPKVL